MKTTRKSLLINTNEMAYKLKGDNNNEKSYYNNSFTYAGHIERDTNGEAMVHDSGESWVYAYTGVISEIKIYI